MIYFSSAPDSQSLMAYIRARGSALPDFFKGMRVAYGLRSLMLVATLSFLLPSFRNHGKRYVIATPRLLDHIAPEDLQTVVLTGGIREFISAIKHRIGFLNTTSLYLGSYLYGFRSDTLRFTYAMAFSKLVASLLRMNNIKAVLIDSDGLPYQRSICLAATASGISVICLQHGYFHAAFPEMDGSLSDLNLVIDGQQYHLFEAAGIDTRRLALIEQLSKPSHPVDEMLESTGRRVILIGEGWASHDIKVDKIYTATLHHIRAELIRLGIRPSFRPHPSERYAISKLLRFRPIVRAGRSKGIDPADIYIGANSSLLIEAARTGALAVQVTGVLDVASDYSRYGVRHCMVSEVPQLVAESLRGDHPVRTPTGRLASWTLRLEDASLKADLAYALRSSRVHIR